MSIAFISHPDCLLHDMGPSHPEQPARLLAIENAVTKAGLKLNRYSAPLVTHEQLLRVHPENYIQHILQSSPQKDLIPLDPDTWMNPFTLQAALRAAGAVVMAVDLVMQKQVRSAFCNVRPPGHHAERNQAMGFCFFNNIAVGVAHALAHYNLKRVAIVDFDVHHGNGTEDIFKNEERVLLLSSFEHPFYPFSGADTKSNHIINIPLSAGTSGKLFQKKVTELWLEPLKQFQPELIFFSAGFDAYAKDMMSDLSFVESDYAWVTRAVKNVCDVGMISSLEGGYMLEGLGQCVVAHLNELTEET